MRSSFWNSKNGDRKYNADHWAEYFAKFIANGVYADPSTSMQVQADSGLTVKIAVGSCFINGREGFAEGDDYLTLDYGGSAPRIDRIVARYDKAKREIQPHIIKGTAAATPTAPALIRDGTYFDLCLADITVAANATTITQANIADRRGNTSLCGWVTGLINQIDTEELFAQFEQAWYDFVAQLPSADPDHITINTADEQVRNDFEEYSKQTDAILATNAPFKILKGIASSSTSAKTITFSEQFSETPSVVCTVVYSSTTVAFLASCHITKVSASEFTVYTKKVTANSPDSLNATVHWVAFGI